ncbi:OprD family outer membrane porin [Endozoicomonas ascidiicola]|uniref:OprD family outer membrane porin n=1 Tax=Endozoicomonas ascidiicola TaxID=1698521 RepID=UPI000833CB9C|nr:OprD family outer membrane porin [Endozoicomonas ascidiicola]
MSIFKPSILSYAVAVLSIPAMANHNNNDSMDDIGKIDGKVQVVHFDEENKGFNDKSIEANRHKGASTGALWLNAETAHFADVVGFGASFYQVVKIDMKDRNEAIHDGNGTDGLLNDSYEPFGNLGQLWVDFKLPETNDGVSANLKAGRQLVETGLITISGSRSVPSAWQGVDAAVDLDGLTGKIAWVDKVSKRNQSGFHDIQNDKGDKIDNVIGMELSYTFDLGNQSSLEIQYRNGLADKYVQSHNGNISFKMPLYDGSELTLGAMYYHAKEDGKRWDLQTSAFEKKGESSGLNATFDAGSLSLTAAFTYSKAKTASGAKAEGNEYYKIGYYDYYFGENTQGAFDMPTASIYSNFNYDKEKAWLIGGEYDFSDSGMIGLSVGYNFIYGSGMKAEKVGGKSKDVSEYEHDVTVKYNFESLGLKDLNLKAQYAYNHNDKEFRMATEQGNAKYLRAWLSYSFEI